MLKRIVGMGWARPARFHTSAVARASLFGEVTEGATPEPVATPSSSSAGGEGADASEGAPAVKDDADLQAYKHEQALAAQVEASKFITPLKRALFNANVAANGFFKNHQVVQHEGATYKVSLTEEEIDVLEPSVYVSSYRLKSSMKKATQVNRFVRGMGVKQAINQLHFNPKKMSTEVEQLLKRGLEQSEQIGLAPESMYIHALWVGSDGQWRKRLDAKGRGRTGVISHPYVHVKAVLKSEQTKLRRQWERQQAQQQAKPRMFLDNQPLNLKVRGYYKW
ncbi:hypothetical protein DIURU_005345 [Diutina rugosa]|uniref:Ribosomal protein L22 n=1 Tax=Diutina rugosa TaxID=5481 RepID=A0A642UE26_DIURU|nr:uncharacterized protein DIURU_005345 [Diutina rugosa]KAA8897368.1 hypothetical protein DIURU_005345 [Diutina rugosa]